MKFAFIRLHTRFHRMARRTHDERRREQYAEYFDFRAHRYPRKLELFVNGSRVITAHVDNLTTSPLAQTLLVAPKGAIERRQCADMKHAHNAV